MTLCELAGVSRSGYYKWKGHSKEPPHERKVVLELVKSAHDAHPSHGYRWIHAFLVLENSITVSPEYIRQAFRFLGIESKTKHKARLNPRKTRDPYPNLIC